MLDKIGWFCRDYLLTRNSNNTVLLCRLQPAFIAACILFTSICPVYLAYELVLVFLVLLMEVRTLRRCLTKLDAKYILLQKEYATLGKVVGFENLSKRREYLTIQLSYKHSFNTYTNLE